MGLCQKKRVAEARGATALPGSGSRDNAGLEFQKLLPSGRAMACFVHGHSVIRLAVVLVSLCTTSETVITARWRARR